MPAWAAPEWRGHLNEQVSRSYLLAFALREGLGSVFQKWVEKGKVMGI